MKFLMKFLENSPKQSLKNKIRMKYLFILKESVKKFLKEFLDESLKTFLREFPTEFLNISLEKFTKQSLNNSLEVFPNFIKKLLENKIFEEYSKEGFVSDFLGKLSEESQKTFEEVLKDSMNFQITEKKKDL